MSEEIKSHLLVIYNISSKDVVRLKLNENTFTANWRSCKPYRS